MSIVACVNVHDAIVFGSDSITTINGTDDNGQQVAVKSYQHAQKLHRLSNHVAVATWGAGNIGARSIRSFVAEYARENGATESQLAVEGIANGLLAHIRAAYEREFEGRSTPGVEIGAMVGGYSPNSELAEILEFSVPSSAQPQRLRDQDEFGASWRGVAMPFTRLCVGIDPFVRAAVLSELDDDPQRRKRVEEALAGSRAPFVFDGMPIQEAVDFVVFILQTTVNMAKFEAGLQSCGGPLWVSAITKDGFQWIRKPSWEVREAS